MVRLGYQSLLSLALLGVYAAVRIYLNRPLKTTTQDEPIRGYKYAYIAHLDRPDEDVWGFCGVGTGASVVYRSGESARCLPTMRHMVPPDHESPQLDCSCGFHAYADPNMLARKNVPGSVLLDVELYGRVICHRLGYRAQKQRIMVATISTRCHFDVSAEDLIDRVWPPTPGVEVPAPHAPATALGEFQTGRLVPVCPECATYREGTPIGFKAVYDNLADIANRVGVELRWASPEHPFPS